MLCTTDHLLRSDSESYETIPLRLARAMSDGLSTVDPLTYCTLQFSHRGRALAAALPRGSNRRDLESLAGEHLQAES